MTTLSTTALSVNLNAVAYLRNRRDLPWPSVCEAARAALQAGAQGITVHPRPDQRHIKPQDVEDLSALIATEFSEVEFNIEGYPDELFMNLVQRVKPHQVTLVPDLPSQSTSDHGWDIPKHRDMLSLQIEALKNIGCRVSLFVNAESSAVLAAASIGADRVELFTGPYGSAFDDSSAACALERLVEAAQSAKDSGISGVNAGHDLTLGNLSQLKMAIPDLAEVSIGHALTADALMLGYSEAVRRYLECLK